MIRIKFSYITRYGQCAGSFVLPDNHGLSKSEIEAMKIERRDKWVESMRKVANRASPLPPPFIRESVAEQPDSEQPTKE